MRKSFQKEVREVRLGWAEQVIYRKEEEFSQIVTEVTGQGLQTSASGKQRITAGS